MALPVVSPRLRRRVLPLLLAALCLSASTPIAGLSRAYAQESARDITNQYKLVRKYVYPLLKNPLFVHLDWQDSFVWKTDQFGRTFLPNELWNHDEGIFRVHNVRADVWDADTTRFGVFAESQIRVIRPGLDTLTEQEAQERSLQLLHTAFPQFFQQGPLPSPTISLPGPDGVWRFRWQRYRADELPDTDVSTEVRAIDGKIVGFDSSKFVGDWPHKITPTQAKQEALQAAAKDSTLADIKIRGWNVGPGGYSIGLQARKRASGVALRSSAYVDAMTGEVQLDNRHDWEAPTRFGASPLGVEDKLPVWTRQGLLFVSNRSLADMPPWAEFPMQALLQDKTGKTSFLTADMKELPALSFVSGQPNGSWAGIEVRNWTYALDLGTGKYRVLGHPERRGGLPTINKEGSWAVITGTGHTGRRNLDLMADKLERDPQLGLRGRLVMPNGDEFLPLFPPDGQWVYFITASENKGTWNYRLQRLAAKDALTKDLARIKPEQVQTIAKLSEDVQRMSFFPDGQRVLLQNRKGMFVVSVPEGKVTRVVPQDPEDVEVGAPITETRDGWAGPGNERVTFSGKTTDKAGKIRWRIYSVNLNGGDLKAHTPRENEPVPMYKFPDSGKTAYDLAREWALGEIKWEDEQKRRNQ